MANVIIKSEERRATEARVAQSFMASGSGEAREAVETIAARSHEAYEHLQKMEARKK